MITYKIACVSNLWVRMMCFEKKGDTNNPHSHPYDHTTLIAKGSFKVTVDGHETLFIAPQMVYIVKEKLHYIEALEDDSLACCIHALRTGEREEDILAPSMICTLDGRLPEGVLPLTTVPRHLLA